VLKRSLRLHRGQSIIIETWTQTLPVAEALAVEARRLGVRPVIFYMPERAFFESQRSASPSDANAIARPELVAIASCDAYLILPGPDDFKRQEALPPANRQAIERRSLAWNRALRLHSVPSVWLLAASPSTFAARQYGVSLRAWEREGFASSAVDPRLLRAEAAPFVEALAHGRHIMITHPNGTHLELGLAGRRPVVDDGVVDAQDLADGRIWTVIPSGLLWVPLDEGFAEGRFVSNRPSRHRRGMIRDVRWTFRRGRLRSYEVGEGRSLFESLYRRAGAERDRVALLDIGLNPRIRSFPLAEDQARGVVTLYIGRNDDFGGRTRGTFREFALLEGADLFVDDRPVLRRGRRA
jgi:leucyl aminopeptidase (aminopeptidase T)